MHANDPINKNGSDILINVPLVPHIESVRLSEFFRQLHVLLDLLAVQADVVDVAQRGLVNLGDFRGHVVLYPLLIGRQFRMEADLGEFVPRA